LIKIAYFKSLYGELIIGSFEGKLCLCDWRYRKMRNAVDKRIQSGLGFDYTEGNSDVIDKTRQQLSQYFNQERSEFDIPLHFVGSDFQKQVWKTLMEIPYGQTDTYLGLSKKLGNDKAIRAVSSANGANAISIIVPCHRIIGSDGKLVGYAGGLDVKRRLLKLEGVNIHGQLSLF
jgi:methylated-DNA-[protein]-cysteine S-methyltransferase